MNEEVIQEGRDKPILSSNQKVGQEQIHDLLFSDKLSWQAIIYDLINTEQLDPWDVDISLLAKKYIEKIKQLEEANFFVSSKVLFAASLLLRMKSEILLDHDLLGLDAILFGKKEEKKYIQERIELDEEIPGLIVRTPLPRYKKISLEELMKALGHAIKTENRRIKKITLIKQQEFEAAMVIPKHRINLQEKIKEIYAKLEDIFSKREDKLSFSELAGQKNGEKVSTFVPLLYLDNQQKVWLEQEEHLAEIWILLKHLYEKQNAQLLESMKKEAAEELAKVIEEQKIMEKINKIKEGAKEDDKIYEDEEESSKRINNKIKNIEKIDLEDE
jgi:segregation and condensation protein A